MLPLGGDLSDLLVDRIEQAGKVGHDCRGQDALEPVGNCVENTIHPTTALEKVVEQGAEQIENKNDVGENFHKTLPFLMVG